MGLMTLGHKFFTEPVFLAAQRYYPDAAISKNVHVLRYTVISILKRSVGLLIILTLLGGLVYSYLDNISYTVFLAMAGLMIANAGQRLNICFFTAARRQHLTAIWLAAIAWSKPLLAVLAVVMFGVSPQSVFLGYLVATGGILLLFYFCGLPAVFLDLPGHISKRSRQHRH